MAISSIVAGAMCLVVAGWRFYHRSHYEYIDLPIVLSNEEEVVKTLRDGMTKRHYQVTVRFTAKGQYSDQIETLAASLVDKALEPTQDPEQGDYLRFQYGGYTVRYSNPQNDHGSYDYTVKILPNYFTNTAQESAVDDVVEEYLDEAGFTALTSDEEKIRTAHDYIVEHCEYDWRNSQLSQRHLKSTAYAALINGEASCQGYSVAMYRLLMESGIPSRIITGYATSPETGESEYHAWNLVRLDGRWYNVDVTWDDETGTGDYYLKSDATFSSHVRDEKYDASDFRAEYPVSAEDY